MLCLALGIARRRKERKRNERMQQALAQQQQQIYSQQNEINALYQQQGVAPPQTFSPGPSQVRSYTVKNLTCD